MINREGAPRSSGENSDDTKAGFFAKFLGRKAFAGFEGESAENNTVENSLDGVTAAIQRLGDNAASRNFGNFSKLVGAADLPEETKQRLLDEYEDGDDFDALVEALSNRAGENKEAKRASLIERLKPKLARTAVIGVAAAVLVGAGALLYRGLKANDNVSASTEAPVKIATEQSTEDAVDDTTEEVPEASILDDESLYTNSNYENFDLDEIGEAVAEHYIDAGEGYEVSENGIQANFSDYNDFENKSSHNAFGKKISDEAIEALEAGDSKMYVDELMTKFVNNPAIASAHISMIEPAMDALEVPDEIKSISGYGERAQAVWNWVREQGGEKNNEVMGALFVSLKAETTEFQVETRSGTDWTMYETVKNTTEQMSIENALLMGQSRIERDDAIQVKTILHFANSKGEEIEVEFTDNTECGVQPTGKVIIRNKTTNIIITIDIPVDDDHEQDQEEQEQEQTQTQTEVTTQDTQEERRTNDTDNKTTEVTTEVESEVTEETSKTPETSETPASDTTKTPEESSEEEESSSEVIKTKDAESLVQGVNQALTDANSNNVVTQTPVIDTITSTANNSTTSNSSSESGNGNTVVSTVTSNDGTTANLNNANQVVSVTDGKTGETVEVTSGDQKSTYEATEKKPEEVVVAVEEGKTYTDDGNDTDNSDNGDNGGGGEDQQQQQIANENQEANELMQLLNNS